MAAKPSKPQTAALSQPAKPVTLNQHLNAIRANAKAAADAGEEAGACLVSDPHTGQNSCLLVDRNTCKSLHGVFIGGPCGN